MKRVSLTMAKAKLALYVCDAALEQHIKMLQHENWDFDYSKKERYQLMWFNRKCMIAAKALRIAISKEERRK